MHCDRIDLNHDRNRKKLRDGRSREMDTKRPGRTTPPHSVNKPIAIAGRRPYIDFETVSRKGFRLSENGLQKTAFFVLVALILYVSITGGA